MNKWRLTRLIHETVTERLIVFPIGWLVAESVADQLTVSATVPAVKSTVPVCLASACHLVAVVTPHILPDRAPPGLLPPVSSCLGALCREVTTIPGADSRRIAPPVDEFHARAHRPPTMAGMPPNPICRSADC